MLSFLSKTAFNSRWEAELWNLSIKLFHRKINYLLTFLLKDMLGSVSVTPPLTKENPLRDQNSRYPGLTPPYYLFSPPSHWIVLASSLSKQQQTPSLLKTQWVLVDGLRSTVQPFGSASFGELRIFRNSFLYQKRYNVTLPRGKLSCPTLHYPHCFPKIRNQTGNHQHPIRIRQIQELKPIPIMDSLQQKSLLTLSSWFRSHKSNATLCSTFTISQVRKIF